MADVKKCKTEAELFRHSGLFYLSNHLSSEGLFTLSLELYLHYFSSILQKNILIIDQNVPRMTPLDTLTCFTLMDFCNPGHTGYA